MQGGESRDRIYICMLATCSQLGCHAIAVMSFLGPVSVATVLSVRRSVTRSEWSLDAESRQSPLRGCQLRRVTTPEVCEIF